MAVTDTLRRVTVGATALAVFCCPALAKVLPEDRADVLYHSYDGDGVQIDGPSVLVRKAYKDKASVWANYYVDMISGASIDVRATASPYSEQREEVSVGADYLYDKAMVGVGFTYSQEDDYEASTLRFSLSQDFFGDLSTLSLGYAIGEDSVFRNGDERFADEAVHQSFSIELSQILTSSLIVNVGYEAVSDEGFLNNPYRSVRYLDAGSGSGYSYQSERYPRTRNSDAIAVRAMYYLPYRAALRAQYRHYSDSWGIAGDTVELSYTHPLGKRFEIDIKARYYSQNAADFYADLFPFQNAQNFLARDKELATQTNFTVGAGVGYALFTTDKFGFDTGTLNLHVDYMQFDYSDFSDVTQGAPVGQEPLFTFDAVVLRAFLSLWF